MMTSLLFMLQAMSSFFLAGLLFYARNAEAKVLTASSIRDDLDFDENLKLATHYVVSPANQPHCGTAAWETGAEEPGNGFQFATLDDDALATVFPTFDQDDEHPDSTSCVAACLEKGTDITVAGHAMPHFHYKSTNPDPGIKEKAQFQNWFKSTCLKVEVCFLNYVTPERTLQVNWIDTRNGNRPIKQFDLEFSERKTRCFHSYIGHEFEAVDPDTGFYEYITIEHATTKAFGTSPPSSSQTFDGVEEIESSVKTALDHEWNKHKMVARTFSSLGFAKGRLPDDVFANMGSFYYNNRANIVNEEWGGKGVFVNWWEADIKFLPIPWGMKLKWQLRLSELVSAWAGVEVEETSMYGLRQYEQGARLLSHVDRMPTHAVSLIVNIAQDNLASPWPIEVFDHADRLHEITMEAGEIVYYESAKNLHSRNRPLMCKTGGCHFVNLFTHYRPVGDGDRWHSNLTDMPNRPPPLLDGQVDYDQEIAACHLPEQRETSENFLGVGTVECNDKRLGHYISPTFYKLKEASDLFRWWKATSDPDFAGFGVDEPSGTDEL